jgi:hypothetical protein
MEIRSCTPLNWDSESIVPAIVLGGPLAKSKAAASRTQSKRSATTFALK